jgi:universal stress protein F
MKRILVAVDASPCAPSVIEAGVELARTSGAKIHLLRVVGLPPEPLPMNGITAAPPTQVLDGILVTAKRDMGDIARRVPPELVEAGSTQVGVAGDSICSYAREHDVDLIVIASHGYRFIDRIIGTTAAKVVNHADRPVLVVRQKKLAA